MSQQPHWPHSYEDQHLKLAVLEYIKKVLGRLEDDSGSLMEIRQKVAKEIAFIAKSRQMQNDGHPQGFVVAPLPQNIRFQMLKKLWHRDFEILALPDIHMVPEAPEVP